MTPPDGRDVAEAAVDLEVLIAERNAWRAACQSLTPGGSEFTRPDSCLRYFRQLRDSQFVAVKRAVLAEKAAIRRAELAECSPTPATAGEPSTTEEREAIARLAQFEDMLQHATYEDVVRRVYGPPRLEAQLRADLRAILALRAGPASSLEGGGEVERLRAALELIRDQPDTSPRMGGRWIDWAKGRCRAALAPHQPEGGDNGRG